MSAIGRYLAEEVVVDYADGLVDRREAQVDHDLLSRAAEPRAYRVSATNHG